MSADHRRDEGAGVSMDGFFCKSRYRVDTWNQLKSLAQVLQESKEDDRKDVKQLLLQDLYTLRKTEIYWGFPGQDAIDILIDACKKNNIEFLLKLVTILSRLIATDQYRTHELRVPWEESYQGDDHEKILENVELGVATIESRPYFEILVIDSLVTETESRLRKHHLEHRRPEDKFHYRAVVVSSFQDALIAISLNYNIQACVVRYTFPFPSLNSFNSLGLYIKEFGYEVDALEAMSDVERSGELGRIINFLRPELDLYLLSEATVESVANNLHKYFKRCFFGSEDYPEMRLTILKGLQQRYDSPFFTALKDYSRQPTGVFHALPISRGKSISKSHWIRDYGSFYGDRMFISETSSTLGGLDSLLNPSGSLRKAQDLAAKAFGAEKCLYVTNGTSTANKIVLQGLTGPGDIVIFGGDSHKSHYYGAILSGADVVVVDTYKLDKYSLSGAVYIDSIVEEMNKLLDLGLLNRLKALVITNITFDGIAYNLEKLFTRCLSIKPDLIFIVDEAWFAYGYFTPLTRRRTAMHVARNLEEKFKSPDYLEEYNQWKKGHVASQNPDAQDPSLLVNPHSVKIRVYSTQSTHKTLTALRQASMILIHDQDFEKDAKFSLLEAYNCHTSTSPNYQILASLDVGRRQMALEGYELVQKAYELAFVFRDCMNNNDLVKSFFRVLELQDFVLSSELEADCNRAFLSSPAGLDEYEQSWLIDDFALEPTRVTLDVSKSGMSGSEFKKVLMSRYDIQVNKTSANTVLFIIHIGSTRGMVTYLLESLADVAKNLKSRTPHELYPDLFSKKHASANCTQQPAQIPCTTALHEMFGLVQSVPRIDGNVRFAQRLAQRSDMTDHLFLSSDLASEVQKGRTIYSASLVTPYPPGYPILMPGQLLSASTIHYLLSLDEEEVHGYDHRQGLRVFKAEALDYFYSILN